MSDDVLNVNDDRANRYVITRVLQHAGFVVREAASGAEALAMVQEQPPSLVVLDVHMPGMNGLEVCRRLRANPLTANIPILQTSATFVNDDSRVLGLESGADGYLAQPIDPSVLVATARALLRTYAAERQVREADVDWQQTFDSLGEPVMIMDQAGAVIRANHAMRDLGVPGRQTHADAALQAALDWTPARLRADAIRTGARAGEEIGYDGRRFQATLNPIAGSAGRVDRLVLVLQDVTDRWRLVEQERARAADLTEANRRKDQMLAMLAHELRNPLNAIATANTVQERLAESDAQLPGLRATVGRQTRHLARLVEDLLEVSRITRGRLALQISDLDLRVTLQQAADAVRSLLDSRRQRLTITLPDEPLPMRGDPLRLEQTFMNLLVNAAKFSEPEAQIVLTCVRRPDEPVAEIHVVDQGIGIDPSRLEAIFELFVQEDNSLARSRGGLGIGLTLARHLVDLHGGTIAAFSEGPGRGTEIRVRLPLAAHAPAPAPSAAPLPAVAPQPLDILVVEDNPDAAQLLRSLLETWGHRVRSEYNGVRGLEAAIAHRPDVAIVDIGLPGIDGYQVAENLRASASTRHIFLIAITGYGRPEDRARALAVGFDRFVVKPIDFDDLEKALIAVPAQEQS